MTNTKTSDAKQVGGDHYKTASQHWNLLPALGYGYQYYTGQAVKYLSRWRKKNGVRDILKAQHFIEKLTELVEEFGAGFLPCDTTDEADHKVFVAEAYKMFLFEFFDSNDVDQNTAAICIAVLFANKKSVLVEAAEHCAELAGMARQEEAEHGHTEVEPPVSVQFKFVRYVDGGTGIEWVCNHCGEELSLGMDEPPSTAHVCKPSREQKV